MLRPFLPMFMPRGGGEVVTPVLTSLRDIVIDTAGGGRAQVATGTGFSASSVIKVGGAAQATTYDAGTGTLSCTMPAHAADAAVPVTVANGAAESGAINVEYWYPGTEASCTLLAEQPDYSVADGTGTWVARVGANLTSTGTAPSDVGGEPTFAKTGALLGADIASLVTTTEATIAIVQKPTSEDVESDGGSAYTNKSMAYYNQGLGTLGIWNAKSADGSSHYFGAHVYDNAGGYAIARSSGVNPLDGNFHITMQRWSYSAGAIALCTDGVWSAPTTLASAGAGFMTGAIELGARYNNIFDYAGSHRAVAAFSEALSDAVAAKFNAWAAQRFNLDLAA